MMQVTEDGLRNMKDFLLTYNKLSEKCFKDCIINLNNRSLTDEEGLCAEVCVTKAMNLNHRSMQVYLVEQPKITQKKVEEAEQQANKIMEGLKSQGYNIENMSETELAAAAIKIKAEQQAA